MAFTDHKITAFAHKISDLADQPNLPPDELKARFDACPEELRQAVNAICDDAAVLDTKVSGIVSGTFEGAVDKSILSDDLAAELDAKATQAALDAETAERETVVYLLQDQIDDIQQSKCELYITSFSSNKDLIDLGFTPKAVLIAGRDTPFGAVMVQPGTPYYYNGVMQSQLVNQFLWLYDKIHSTYGAILAFK